MKNVSPASQLSLVVIAMAVAIGLALRIYAANVIGPHIDEAESVLAARMAARSGLPILPSGVLFLQGLSLSYLLPFFDTAADPLALANLRLLSAVAGTASIAMIAVVAKQFGASPAVAAFAAVALATDGTSIEWSAHVRPYAALQLLTLVLWSQWLGMFASPSGARSLAFAMTFALAVFTHIGIVLIVPMLFGWSAYNFRGALLRGRQDLGLALASFILPIATFLAINAAFGVSTSGSDTDRPGFIGDHVLTATSLFHPEIDAWVDLFQRSSARSFMRYILVFSAAVLVLRRESDTRIFALLATYAVPIAAVIFLTTEAQARYIVHLHPLGLIIIGMGIAEIAQIGGTYGRNWRILAAAGLWASTVHFVDGAWVRLTKTAVDPDYAAALRWLQTAHVPGEPILAAMTSVTALSTLPQADILFLAGPIGVPRTSRYTRAQPDGRVTDYWSGVPTIRSTGELCTLLAVHADAWLVVDDERLTRGWAFGGEMESVIVGTTWLAHRVEDVGLYRARATDGWSVEAKTACKSPYQPPSLPP